MTGVVAGGGVRSGYFESASFLGWGSGKNGSCSAVWKGLLNVYGHGGILQGDYSDEGHVGRIQMMSASVLGWEGKDVLGTETEAGRIAGCNAERWKLAGDSGLEGTTPETGLEVHRTLSCPAQGWGKRRGLLTILEAMGNH